MFYFKDSEYPNSETKTGTTGSFIKYVEKHSCYKAAEKLLLALAERNKECAVYIRPPKLKKKSSVDFYFEEIELSEEEINAFKLLGKYKNALLEKTPVIIQLHFTLYDELSEYIKKVNVHLSIESFSSNYHGSYYGEIYDNANYNYNGEKSIVVSNIERPLESKKGELVVHLINIEFCKSQLSSSLFNRLYPLKKIKFNRSIGNDLFFFKKFVTKEKIRFDSSESSLFCLVFEYTKYIPELIQGLVNSSPDTKIDTEVMSIVLESLNYLYKLFTEEFCREELVIKIKELKNNSYMYRILPAYIVDEIAAIQNLSLPYKKVEDSNDSQ